MMRVPRVKICGLGAPEHAAAAAGAGADFVGLNFVEGVRRRVTVEQAKAITAALPPRRERAVEVLSLSGEGLWFQDCAAALDRLIERGRPLVVGLFADQPLTLVNAIAEAADLDLIQLCGDEPGEVCLRLRRPVIRMLRAAPGTDAGALRATLEPGTASLCLLDAHVPGERGGTGALADWDVAARLAATLPLMLAGGLNPGNVGAAIRRVQPWAVDVSSGVEREGVKDVDLIQDFIRTARSTPVGTVFHGA